MMARRVTGWWSVAWVVNDGGEGDGVGNYGGEGG